MWGLGFRTPFGPSVPPEVRERPEKMPETRITIDHLVRGTGSIPVGVPNRKHASSANKLKEEDVFVSDVSASPG